MAASGKVRGAKTEQSSFFHGLLLIGYLLKAPPIFGVGLPISVKAVKVIPQLRDPAQAILNHGKLTFKINYLGAGEMAQRLRALAVLPKDPGSIPSTHMAAHSCL